MLACAAWRSRCTWEGTFPGAEIYEKFGLVRVQSTVLRFNTCWLYAVEANEAARVVNVLLRIVPTNFKGQGITRKETLEKSSSSKGGVQRKI